MKNKSPQHVEAILRAHSVTTARSSSLALRYGSVGLLLPTLARCFRLVRWIATSDITQADPLEWATEVRERAEKLMGVK